MTHIFCEKKSSFFWVKTFFFINKILIRLRHTRHYIIRYMDGDTKCSNFDINFELLCVSFVCWKCRAISRIESINEKNIEESQVSGKLFYRVCFVAICDKLTRKLSQHDVDNVIKKFQFTVTLMYLTPTSVQ